MKNNNEHENIISFEDRYFEKVELLSEEEMDLRFEMNLRNKQRDRNLKSVLESAGLAIVAEDYVPESGDALTTVAIPLPAMSGTRRWRNTLMQVVTFSDFFYVGTTDDATEMMLVLAVYGVYETGVRKSNGGDN